MTEAPENSPFSTMIAGLEAMFPVTQAALAIYISQIVENILETGEFSGAGRNERRSRSAGSGGIDLAVTEQGFHSV